MKMEIELNGTLLGRRQTEWAHWLASPDHNPLVPDVLGRLSGDGFTLQNDLCVYSQLQPEYAEGLLHSGIIVTRRPCETVFDLTPAEAAAMHALLAEVRAQLDATVRPDGYTLGWNVHPAGGQHIPHVHLHVIPRWNSEAAAGAGLRYFLRAAAQAKGIQIRPATPSDLPAIHALILGTGLSSDPALITATLAGCSYWLAVKGGEVLGCIGLEHGEGASLLRSACVLPGHRGQGLGTQLAASAMDAARGRGDRAVYLFSTQAGGYWARLGFVPVPTNEVAAALPATPQVLSGECRGWIAHETAWKLDWSSSPPFAPKHAD